jgi:putative membrane protein
VEFLINILISGLAVFIASYILPGVTLDNFLTAIFVGLLLGIINVVIKPILILLTLPITLITLGLFTFIINALMVILVDALITGFSVNNFWTAIVFSLVLSLVNWGLKLLKQ